MHVTAAAVKIAEVNPLFSRSSSLSNIWCCYNFLAASTFAPEKFKILGKNMILKRNKHSVLEFKTLNFRAKTDIFESFFIFVYFLVQFWTFIFSALLIYFWSILVQNGPYFLVHFLKHFRPTF